MSRSTLVLLPLLVLLLALAACTENGDEDVPKPSDPPATSPAPETAPADAPAAKPQPPADATQLATFGAGCFWCVEAVFERLEGVISVTSGYAGGHVENPTYKQVCAGTTGHAEVAQIRFDPKKISFAELLDVFFHVHDPTTLNRQGNDVGTQYRSVVFFHDETQKAEAERVKKALDDSKTFRDPIVTEISPFERFYPAEDYHQEYFDLNPEQGYCKVVIRPKVEKFEKKYAEKLKKEETRGAR